MDRIKMTTPIVKMDGDEITRILWQIIRDDLLLPYIDLKTEYYGLGLERKDETNDQVTIDSADATKKYGVAAKCATITPNATHVEGYHLKGIWKGPNGTIHAILDGTVLHTLIMVKGIDPCIRNWRKPVTTIRHTYGDVYKGSETKIPSPGEAELARTVGDGSKGRELVHDSTCLGIVQDMHNIDKFIESFTRSCFSHALGTEQEFWFATEDTTSKKYDHIFKGIFREIFDSEYTEEFEAAGIIYFHTLIDDAVARVIRSEGGYIWACRSYDGDVVSDMISSTFGSLIMATPVLVSPDGNYGYEITHGTVQRHYYKHLEREETSTNPATAILAWTGALRRCGELDDNKELIELADKLEKATIDTIEGGETTKDLALIITISNPVILNSGDFIKVIAGRL